MTEQQTITINGYEEETRGWAVYDENNERWVAIYACTREDWNNDAENHDEAPGQEYAENIVNSGCADDGGFTTGSRDEIVATIRHHVATDADKLMRNMLALLDSVVAGGHLYYTYTPEDQTAKSNLLGDYATIRRQLSAAFAHPLESEQDIRGFLLATEDWAV